MKAGDKALVLVGGRWHGCVVLAVQDFAHWSGRASRRYTCRFDDGGGLMQCGRNSIRPPREPRARPR